MLRTRILFVLATAGLCLAGAGPWCATAAATETDMARLPLSEPFLCLACHSVETPQTGSAPLNLFGDDYLANGRVWDLNLASLDSDGDECNNGVEIGDADGNGEPDGNVEAQGSNPGVGDDCSPGGLVDERTWGALKAMFDRR